MSIIQGYSSSSNSENESSNLPEFPRYKITTITDVEIPKNNQIMQADNGNKLIAQTRKRRFGGEIEDNYYDDATFRLQSKLARAQVRKSVTKAQAKRIKKWRHSKGNPEDADFLGPWAKYNETSDGDIQESEKDEEVEEVEEKIEVQTDDSDKEPEEALRITTEFVGSSKYDYLGRTYMHIPRDLSISLTKEPGSQECFVPKKIIHTFKGHSKGVNKLEYFPKSGHLLLSCGNDGKIKLWDLYHKRELLRVYYGHNQAVKDITFNRSGSEFLSCSFDKKIHLWNTETGEIIKTVSLKSIPNVIKYNPNNENEFIVGLTNHKIEHYDLSSPNYQTPLQTYDHHLGAINSLTIIDDDIRFMSTSDDKTVRFWDWRINIPIKCISDPSQHSMPTAALYPGGKYIALQSMDNSIQVIQGHGKFKFNKKKYFAGHNVAGYGIGIDISPDGKIIMSGDSNGSGYFWDWKTCKVVKKIKVSDKPINCIKFHPQEASKVVMAGMGGEIFYCD